ncbi:hypothetical protein WN51_04396 [Melipona quadrifasciata]|uniref:Uncharacterized protein n=1 Tax=Melipona quadrifasciata TaxID=166423 RepID=A0A0N0BE25_9HYME|nr:hypothetical protein WN51_04396 [Melipona quadrifasciata]
MTHCLTREHCKEAERQNEVDTICFARTWLGSGKYFKNLGMVWHKDGLATEEIKRMDNFVLFQDTRGEIQTCKNATQTFHLNKCHAGDDCWALENSFEFPIPQLTVDVVFMTLTNQKRDIRGREFPTDTGIDGDARMKPQRISDGYFEKHQAHPYQYRCSKGDYSSSSDSCTKSSVTRRHSIPVIRRSNVKIIENRSPDKAPFVLSVYKIYEIPITKHALNKSVSILKTTD